MNKILVAGFFDPIHPGHLDMFKFAKEYTRNSHVIVVIHPIEHILKKSKFYVYTPEELMALLKGYKQWIDEVVVSVDDDLSLMKTITLLKPQYFIKGPDRNPNNMPWDEICACENVGCEIVYQNSVKVNNSSKIKERVANQFNKSPQ